MDLENLSLICFLFLLLSLKATICFLKCRFYYYSVMMRLAYPEIDCCTHRSEKDRGERGRTHVGRHQGQSGGRW